MKTLATDVKAAFASAGIALTPSQENVAASATSINWIALLQQLGTLAAQVMPTILAIISLFGGGSPAPSPVPAAKTGSVTCDHHKCCCDTLKAALKTVECASAHCCDCCC